MAYWYHKCNTKNLKTESNSHGSAWAMRWVKELENVQVVLSGMNELSQMRDNVSVFSDDNPLSNEEQELIKKAAALLRKDTAFPCTACRYCTPNCPMELDIPELLRAYNDMKTGGAWRLINLFGLPEEKRPSACIGCGACTAHCPQSLAVPEAMKEMAEIMAKMEHQN